VSKASGMGGIHDSDSRAQILKYPGPPGELQSEEGKDYTHPAGWLNSRHLLGKPRVREQAGSGAILGAAL